MSSNPTHEPNSSTDASGRLEARSTAGILVHLVAIPTGVVGAGLVYLASSDGFTKRNARHALNWHLTVFVLWGLSGVLFALGSGGISYQVATHSVQLSVAPISSTAVEAIIVVVILLTVVSGVVATLKATVGSAWPYPGGVDIINGDTNDDY